MDFFASGAYWKAILSVLALLAFSGCLSGRDATTPPVVPSEDLLTTLPTAAAQGTLPVTADSTAEGTSSPGASEDCSRGDYFDTLESTRQVRQYLLHVPATYDPEKPTPVVLVFHGAGIGAERFVGYSRFSNVSDREGFLIVYPQGLGDEPVWNPSPGSYDVQFVSDLIDHLQRRCHVDPSRIYASGHSNGGGMVNRLACDLANRIAAIGPVSGAYAASGRCSPSRPVPVFAIHGTADPIVPYDNIPDWASAWAARNSCDPEPVDIPHNVLIHEKKWSNCREEADVILYTIEDLGHDWTHDLIDMGQTIWGFFEQHPMGGATP
ncbi:MAG TPA: PHB depolymerase family esterase [Anaerolineales bacterium]|nr:PHB depolymerase family esterase [Anaerolineales bacterium]